MTTAIPKDLLTEEYIHKNVRVLVNDGGDGDVAMEGALVGVNTDRDGNVCLALADSRNKADPDFTFIDGDDIVRIEVLGQLGPVVVYVADNADPGSPYAFEPLEDPTALATKTNGPATCPCRARPDGCICGCADDEQCDPAACECNE